MPSMIFQQPEFWEQLTILLPKNSIVSSSHLITNVEKLEKQIIKNQSNLSHFRQLQDKIASGESNLPDEIKQVIMLLNLQENA